MIVESIIPSGRVKKIDATAAQAMPGVLRILTHADAIALKSSPMVPVGSVMESFRPLQDDHILYNGQPIALVVARFLNRPRKLCVICASTTPLARQSPTSTIRPVG